MPTHDPNQYTADEQLGDRLRHAIVFAEALARALRDLLALLIEKEVTS